MARRALVGGLVLFAAVAAVLWIPWATKDRVVVSATPVPAPLFSITPAPVRPGAVACMTNVTFSQHTDIAEIGLGTGGKPGPPLDITASAKGYDATAHIDGGYPDDPAAHFKLEAPPGPVIGQLCIRNAGRVPVSLNSTNEWRTMGRPTLTIDGVAQPMDAKLIFYDRIRSSYLWRTGRIAANASTFTPAFFSQTVLVLLALLALMGIPTAMAAALAYAARSDEDDDDVVTRVG